MHVDQFLRSRLLIEACPSIERVPGGLFDQVFGLALELLGELLPEPRVQTDRS